MDWTLAVMFGLGGIAGFGIGKWAAATQVRSAKWQVRTMSDRLDHELSHRWLLQDKLDSIRQQRSEAGRKGAVQTNARAGAAKAAARAKTISDFGAMLKASQLRGGSSNQTEESGAGAAATTGG